MITTEFLSGLDRFNLIMRKRVTSKYAGSRPSVMTGKGATIKDFRLYALGDDFRQIDWRVYARTDNLYVKRYEEEKNLLVHILIDASSSMNFGKPSKFDYASMLGIGFAYIAMRSNEKFRYATFAESLNMFQSKRGMGHLARMVELLNTTKPEGSSDLAKSLAMYKKNMGTRSMIFIISDFLFDIENFKHALYYLGNNDVKLIQVLDPAERNLAVEGDLKLKDSETGTVMRTYVSQKLRSDYQRQLETHIANLKNISSLSNFSFHTVTTNTPVFDSFYRILK